MGNENYRKCRTCRFCIHSGSDWVCSIRSSPVNHDGTCERYRPGSCENCSNLVTSQGKTACSITAEETDTLSVCSDYDPSGRRSA